jgi:hypothetical protein
MAVEDQTRLLTELDYYAVHKGEWLSQQAGKYVVIKERQVLGFFSSFPDAFKAGAVKYGLETDFLVKQIVEREPVFFVF